MTFLRFPFQLNGNVVGKSRLRSVDCERDRSSSLMKIFFCKYLLKVSETSFENCLGKFQYGTRRGQSEQNHLAFFYSYFGFVCILAL